MQSVRSTASTSEANKNLPEAILRTLLYADAFDFPMREAEIHHFLIDCPATSDEVHAALEGSAWLAERIQGINGYFALRDHTQIIAQRADREYSTQILWPRARRFGLILAHLPFVRMVALTGALAMHNPDSSHDDLDYLLVTTPGRVWTGRAFAIVVVRIAKLFRVHLCPNYVLSENALLQDQHNLFIAHEITQMIPLSGLPVYEAMREANRWTFDLLPNADTPFYLEPDHQPRGLGALLQKTGEFLLSGPLGDAFERWEQRRKLRKFEAQAKTSTSSAQLDHDHVKGHFNDYGYPALQRYHERVVRYFGDQA